MGWFPHRHDDRYVEKASQLWSQVVSRLGTEVVDQADIDDINSELANKLSQATAEGLFAEKAVETTAERAASRVFDVRAYGAVGDNVADDTAALQACADACEAVLGTYYVPAHMICRITSQVDLRYIRSVDIQGRIVVGHTDDVGVLVGNSSGEGEISIDIDIADISYAESQSNVALRAVGLKTGTFRIGKCPHLQLYADTGGSAMGSLAYTDWYLGKVDTVELLGATDTSWINENRFHGGRVTTIIVGDGTNDYPHNNNRWEDANLEASTITFHAGQSNYIRARLESGSAITFAAGTHSNRVVQTYYAISSVIWPASNLAVTDNGSDNKVVTTKQEAAVYVPVIRVDSASRTTNTASAWNVNHATRRIRPGFRKLTMPNNATDYIDTGIFPVESVTPPPLEEGGAQARVFRIVSDVSVWRPLVWVYDANRALLDGGSGGPYIETSGGWSWSTFDGGRYSIGSNVGASAIRLIFTHPDVKYARIALRGNDTTTPFTYVEIGAFVQAPHGTQLVDHIRRQMDRPLYQTGTTAPTHSLLSIGEQITTDTGILLVTHRVDTTLSVAAATSATSITVASATGIASGDTIAVLLDDDTTHFTTVSGAPAGNVVTLTAGLPSAAGIGKNVATQRFLHIT